MSRKYVPWCAQRTHTVQARTTFVAAGTPAGPTHKSPAVLDNLPLLSEDTTQIFVPTLQQPAPPPSPRFSHGLCQRGTGRGKEGGRRRGREFGARTARHMVTKRDSDGALHFLKVW